MLSSTSGEILVVNNGCESVLIGQTSVSSPGTVSSGYLLHPGQEHTFPSDDGASGSRIGYTVASDPGAASSLSSLMVIGAQ